MIASLPVAVGAELSRADGLFGLPEWSHVWQRWLATSGLAIALWIIGGILMVRFIRWMGAIYDRRQDRLFHASDELVVSEQSKHQRALVDVVVWTVVSIVVIAVILQCLHIARIPLTGLVGAGAVLGAAIGFGAQQVVKDTLAGLFVVTERQYGYGDVVRLYVTSGGIAEGTVADVTLRVTRLRTSDGEMLTVPNGQIITVTNQSREWARSVIDVPVPADADIAKVTDVLDNVGEAFYKDPRWHPLMLDKPESLGVTNLGLSVLTVRVVTRTLPGKQWDVGRALRVKIVQGLAEAGITVSESAAAGADKVGPDKGGEQQ